MKFTEAVMNSYVQGAYVLGAASELGPRPAPSTLAPQSGLTKGERIAIFLGALASIATLFKTMVWIKNGSK